MNPYREELDSIINSIEARENKLSGLENKLVKLLEQIDLKLKNLSDLEKSYNYKVEANKHLLSNIIRELANCEQQINLANQMIPFQSFSEVNKMINNVYQRQQNLHLMLANITKE